MEGGEGGEVEGRERYSVEFLAVGALRGRVGVSALSPYRANNMRPLIHKYQVLCLNRA